MTKEPKAARSKPPEEMTYFEANAKLFPGHDDAQRSGAKIIWTVFSPPPPLFEIDELVKDLRERNKIKDREWKKKHGDSCPYYVARCGVVLAVARAHHAKEAEIGIRASQKAARSAEEETRDLAESLSDFLDKTPNTTFAPRRNRGTARTNYEELNEALTASVEAYSKIRSAVEALETLSTLAKAACPPEQQERANEWAATFIESLGYTWLDLTGERPKIGDPNFEAFLESAYRSLGGVQKISWPHQAKNSPPRFRTTGVGQVRQI